MNLELEIILSILSAEKVQSLLVGRNAEKRIWILPYIQYCQLNNFSKPEILEPRKFENSETRTWKNLKTCWIQTWKNFKRFNLLNSKWEKYQDFIQTDSNNIFEHEYLRSRAFICLSLSSPSTQSFSNYATIQILLLVYETWLVVCPREKPNIE